MFSEFWAKYPRRVSKLAAMKAYEKALKLATHAEIMGGLELYLGHLPRETQFIPHASTWLNAGRWMDEYEDAQLVKKLQDVKQQILERYTVDPTWDKKRDCPHGSDWGGHCFSRAVCEKAKLEQSA